MAEKIVLADDNQGFRETLTELLQSRGFEVVACADGVSAEAAAKEGCHLLILDLLMPKKAGQAVAEAVRADNRELPIIMMSGVFKTPQQAKEAKDKYGVKEYLVKPFEGEAFLVAVETSLGRAPKVAAQSVAPASLDPLPEKGSCQDHPAGLLMFRAQSERQTGILDLIGGQERMRLFFYRGMLAMAQSTREGRNIGTELVKMGLLTAGTLRQSLEEMGRSSVGLFKAVTAQGFVDEAKAREGYKTLAPAICSDAVGFVGRFKWTPNEAWVKLIPVVSVPVLPPLMDGLKSVGADVLEKLLEKKKTARLNRGAGFDRFSPSIDQALGPEVSRAINGRARVGQIVEAAPNPEARRARLQQVHALLCMQAAVALDDGSASTAGPSMAPILEPILTPVEPMPVTPPVVSAPPAAAPMPPRMAQPAGGASVLPPGARSGGGVAVVPVPRAAAAPVPPTAPRPARVPPEMQPVIDEIEQRFAANPGQTHFEVLGVTDKDDVGTVKRAYFALAGKFHTDKFVNVDLGDVKPKLDAVFAHISEAYEVLSKPERRAEYDAMLKLKAAGGSTDIGTIFEAESQFTKAEAVLMRGDFIAANKLLERALELDPKDLYRAYKIYAAFRVAGMPKSEAAKALKELEELAQKTAVPKGNEFMGYVAKAAENYVAARNYFRAVMTEPQGNRAIAQRELQQIEKLIGEGKDPKASGMLGKLFKS